MSIHDLESKLGLRFQGTLLKSAENGQYKSDKLYHKFKGDWYSITLAAGSKSEARLELFLKTELNKLLVKYGPLIWLDQGARREYQWMPDASQDNRKGLYPRDLCWSNLDHRSRLTSMALTLLKKQVDKRRIDDGHGPKTSALRRKRNQHENLQNDRNAKRPNIQQQIATHKDDDNHEREGDGDSLFLSPARTSDDDCQKLQHDAKSSYTSMQPETATKQHDHVAVAGPSKSQATVRTIQNFRPAAPMTAEKMPVVARSANKSIGGPTQAKTEGSSHLLSAPKQRGVHFVEKDVSSEQHTQRTGRKSGSATPPLASGRTSGQHGLAGLEGNLDSASSSRSIPGTAQQPLELDLDDDTSIKVEAAKRRRRDSASSYDEDLPDVSSLVSAMAKTSRGKGKERVVEQAPESTPDDASRQMMDDREPTPDVDELQPVLQTFASPSTPHSSSSPSAPKQKPDGTPTDAATKTISEHDAKIASLLSRMKLRCSDGSSQERLEVPCTGHFSIKALLLAIETRYNAELKRADKRAVEIMGFIFGPDNEGPSRLRGKPMRSFMNDSYKTSLDFLLVYDYCQVEKWTFDVELIIGR